MNILFNINQKKAFRRGVDAPNSTELVEVNPADLTEEQRDTLFIFLSGNKSTARVSISNQGYGIDLISATQDNVIAEIDRINAEILKKQQADDHEAAVLTDKIEAFILNPKFEDARKTIGINHKGKVSTYQLAVSKNITYRKILNNFGSHHLRHVTDELADRYRKCITDNEKSIDDILSDIDKAEMLAEYNSLKEIEDKHYNNLSEIVRVKYNSDYADNDEFEAELQKVIVKSRGFDAILTSSKEQLGKLSDEQFVLFNALKIDSDQEKTPFLFDVYEDGEQHSVFGVRIMWVEGWTKVKAYKILNAAQ